MTNVHENQESGAILQLSSTLETVSNAQPNHWPLEPTQRNAPASHRIVPTQQ